MADEKQFEDDVEEPVEKQSRPLLRIILVVALALVAGGGAVFYFMRAPAPGDGAENADAQAVDSSAGDKAAGEETKGPGTAYYFSLNPPFVVNFVGKGRARFLQVNIDGLTRDPAVKEDITAHLPHIRNNIVFILSSKRYEELITPEGKEALRKQVLVEIKKILKQETGHDDVEDVYFTSFVMQ